MALFTADEVLPEDFEHGTFVGRVWRPDVAGPSVVRLDPDGVIDVTSSWATVRDLIEEPDPAGAIRAASGERVADLAECLAATASGRDDKPRLLAPVDLQAIKASGVTFVRSMLERVIEEHARGDPSRAETARAEMTDILGSSIAEVRPGSPEAAELKQHLSARDLWSPYLEVGLGPDAELFTKAQPMAAVGTGADIGVHPDSAWNNPEPEVVLVIAASGRIQGATLGNDVNLRDFEGRSALLLGRAKDNNASCAIGPFIRLFDGSFGLDDAGAAEVRLEVDGMDGFRLDDTISMTLISRTPADLAGQLVNRHHPFPDGAALFLGTMFAPTQDRGTPGSGFTHHAHDVVRIRSPLFGGLINRVLPTDECPPWTFGARALMANLTARGLLQA